jgi:hypothetical protein
LAISTILSAQNANELHSVYFAPSSVSLQEEAQLDLYKLRRELAQEKGNYHIEIHAHTDNVGTFEENRKLSERRAKAVADYLCSQGFDAQKIKDYTYGEEAPKANNISDNGRKENRRVDVLVFYEKQETRIVDFTKNKTVSNIDKMSPDALELRAGVLDIAKSELEAEVQIYDIDPMSDTLLVCKYGTAIYIQANTFLPTKDKQKITIAINEVYKKSDMILSNFSTSSNGSILESGGMVNITAFDGNKEYLLPLQHDLTFFFPTANMRGDMDLFYGENDVNGNIDWTLARRGIKDYEGYLAEAELEETADGNYFDNLGLERRRRIINPKSNIICINQALTNGMGVNPNPLCRNSDACPLFWCRFEKVFTPKEYARKIAAEYKACLENMIAETNLDNDLAAGDLLELENEMKRRYGNSPQKMREALEKRKAEILERAFDEGKMTIEAMNFYVFNTRKMGTINCDAFLNTGENNEVLTFELPKEAKILDTKLVFKSRNSVLNGAYNNGKVSFKGLPKGEEVSLVAIDYSTQGKPRLSIHNLTTGKDKSAKIEFKELSSAEELKKALKSLDL